MTCVHLKDDFHIVTSMIAQMTDEEVQPLQYFRGVYENNSLVSIHVVI